MFPIGFGIIRVLPGARGFFSGKKGSIDMKRLCFTWFALSVLMLFPIHLRADFQKMKIAVLDFNLQGDGKVSLDMEKIVAEWIITAFVKEGRFDVVERRLLQKVLNEQKLAADGVVNKQGAAMIGNLLGSRIVITGSLMSYQNIIEVNARIIDVESASIIAAESVKGSTASRLEALVIEMSKKIIANFPLDGYIVHREGRGVMIDLGRRAGAREGMRFLVHDEGNVIRHPKTGEVLDVEIVHLGVVAVSRVREKVSEARIVEERAPGAIQYGKKVKSVLEKPKPARGRLQVNAAPSDARVRILNIREPFRQGMALEGGAHLLEISAEGYVTKKLSIVMKAGENRTVDVSLARALPPEPPPSPPVRTSTPEPAPRSPEPEPEIATETGPREIAALPWRLRKDARSLKRVLMKECYRAFKKNRSLTLKYSYYRYPGEYGIETYEGRDVDLEKHGDKWVRLLDGDVGEIGELGERLKVDAVLIGEMSAVDRSKNGAQLLGYIRAHLVDVRTRKVVSAKSSAAGELARLELPRVLRDLLRQYEKAYSNGP